VRYFLTIFTVLLFSATSVARAQTLTAESGIGFKTNGTPNISVAGKSQEAEYKLGRNFTQVQNSTDNSPSIISKYEVLANKDDTNSVPSTVTDSYGPLGFSTTATAVTTISNVKTLAAGGYSYQADLDTSVVRTLFLAPNGFARANFRDPQFVSDPGIYGSDFTLLAGTRLFSSGLADGAFNLGLSLAADFYNGTGNPVDELGLQIFEIIATRSSSAIDVSVSFSSDPRLEFYSLANDTPITASEVRSMILSAPGLGDSTGLLSDLPLFYYTMDLTATTLESNAAFGSLATSHAQTIPEPSSLVLMGCGVMGLIVARLKKRNCTI